MLAHHPITGKEVRVIQTDFALYREHRTLYFGESGSAPWDTVWIEGGGQYAILLEPVTIDKLASISSRCLLTLVGRSALGSLTPDDFRARNLKNILVLEEFHLLYPHLGEPWDGTLRDAVCLLAGLLRVRRLAGVYGPRAAALGIEEQKDSPPPLVWITQTYTPANKKRAREIQKALTINANSRWISRILLLNESKEQVPTGARVTIEERIIGKRLSYRDVFQTIASLPPQTLCCFANADIAIDDQTWGDLWNLNLENTFLALLRYDVPESGEVKEAQIFGPRADSQDTWVVRAGDVAARGEAFWAKLDFQFGRMGCDNAIALDMLRAKFRVSNPAYSLKTWHFHASEIRGYNKMDILERPVFHYVKPTGISDMNPLTQIPDSVKLSAEILSFPLRGDNRENWVRAVNLVLEEGEEAWKADAIRSTLKEFDVMFSGKKLIESSEGVCFGEKGLYIGPAQKAQEVWARTDLYPLSPTMISEKGILVPWVGKGAGREKYILKYLSKMFRVRDWADKTLGTGWSRGAEFFCEENKEYVETLQVFNWDSPSKPVLKWEEDSQIYVKEAVGISVSDQTAVRKEEIDALRSAVQGWSEKIIPYGGRLRIVLVDTNEFRTEQVAELEDVLERAFEVRVVYAGRTSPERMVDVLRGAWGLICGPGIVSCGWNWMLPRGATVFEVGLGSGREELTAGIYLSAASGLEHRLCKRDKDSILEAVFAEEEAARLRMEGGKEDLPVVYIPRRDLMGYFGHPGDSFRELARLWAKRGYCLVAEHPTATHCWWGAVGKEGVLLYDRPNHDWRLAAPLPEKEWRWALFGNPAPPRAAERTGGPWIFWARRPELLEELINTGLGSKIYQQRREGVVFIGKVENKVQQKRRLEGGMDWSAACVDGEWHMAGKDEKHKFTHSEYYERMAGARFGLCLAGYGLKCHRETECMALGVVPLCAPEVDMDSYAVPPREGVEYIRVKTPEEAAAVARDMSPARWAELSAAGREWWKRVCSAEGSFTLTKTLIENLKDGE